MRLLCCLDLDTFFVSVERLLDPSLVGRPVVVGGPRGGRGVVSACSYEVRKHGVRSGMPLGEASRLAPPDAVFLGGRYDTYAPYASRVREVLERYTPAVQAASIDEFYLDFAGCARLYRRPGDADDGASIERAVRLMCADIQREVGLPASAGIGTSRVISKVASGRAKPAGVLLIRPGEETDFLSPLPVRKLPGIGPKAEARLHAAGLFTLGELVSVTDAPRRTQFAELIARVEGEMAGHGVSTLGRERPAFREYDPDGLRVGSISNERTFFDLLDRQQTIDDQLLALTERVCWRARKRGMRARTVGLKVRFADFQTVLRSTTGPATNDEKEVLSRVRMLYAEHHQPRPKPVRLVGIALSNLVGDEGQMDLPFSTGKRISHAVDAIRLKCGYDAVRLGSTTPLRRPGDDRE